MKPLARLVALLGLLLTLSSAGHAQPKDVLGWREARWGMSDSDIAATFGIKLQKQRETTLYGYNGTLSYILPEIQLQGQIYSAYFQMDLATGKLKGIYIRLDETKSRVPREDIFNSLESLLSHKFGAPASKKDDRPSEIPIKTLRLSRTWKFPTTTVELSYEWWNSDHDSLVTIRYFPTGLKEH